MDDVKSLTHTKWNCKYHVCLPQNTEGKYFMRKNELRSGQYFGSCVGGKG